MASQQTIAFMRLQNHLYNVVAGPRGLDVVTLLGLSQADVMPGGRPDRVALFSSLDVSGRMTPRSVRCVREALEVLGGLAPSTLADFRAYEIAYCPENSREREEASSPAAPATRLPLSSPSPGSSSMTHVLFKPQYNNIDSVCVPMSYSMASIKHRLLSPPAVVNRVIVGCWPDDVKGAIELFQYINTQADNPLFLGRLAQALIQQKLGYLLNEDAAPSSGAVSSPQLPAPLAAAPTYAAPASPYAPPYSTAMPRIDRFLRKFKSGLWIVTRVRHDVPLEDGTELQLPVRFFEAEDEARQEANAMLDHDVNAAGGDEARVHHSYVVSELKWRHSPEQKEIKNRGVSVAKK